MLSRVPRLLSVVMLGLIVVGGAWAAKKDAKKDAKNDPKAEESSAAPAAAAEPGVIALMGDAKITEADLMASLPPANQKAFEAANQRIQEMERLAVKEIFADRYVAGELAASPGLSEDAFYARELAANRNDFKPEYQAQIAQAKGQIYDGKRAALDELINKKLEENAAKAKGLTPDAYIKSEVDDKIASISQADIDQFYTQNEKQFGGQTKEAVSPQIGDMIKRNRVAQRRNELRTALRADASIRTLLEVPRIAVSADDDPVRGSRNAPVQIVLFSDFQCPYCSRVETTLKQVSDRYGDKVSIVFRDYPLGFHQFAQKAAEAANCAHKLGKYWEYHDALFANQGQLDLPSLKKQAESLGLDLASFNQCLDSGEMKAEVEKDLQAGIGYGVNGTPASFINGRLVSGALPFDGFARIVEDELQMKGIPIPPAPSPAAAPSQ